MINKLSQSTLLCFSLLSLGACSSSSDSDPATGDDTGSQNPPLGSDNSGLSHYAYVASRSADYGSGRIDRISLADGNVVEGSYPATLSDIDIDTDGTHVFQIGRLGIDSLTRYNALDSSLLDYQYSVNGDEATSANPQDLAFIDGSKAYLTRYGSDAIWIINPSAGAEEQFKFGELDLGAYDTDAPEMTDAIIVDDKLFVLMERLTNFVPDKTAFIAVFDTRFDTEIETAQSVSDLMGIELLVKNPTSLQYNAETGKIYVLGRGNYFENENVTTDFHSGGIEEIDPTTYEHSLLLDDGTDEENNGYFSDAVVVDSNLGYLLTYAGFGATTLRTFNPTSGALLGETYPELEGVDITTLTEGPDNHLWIGINDATPGFYRLDTVTGVLAQERVATELIPQGVSFISIENN